MNTLERLVMLGATTLVGCQQPSYDTGIEPVVVLYPENPHEGDTLHCRVDGVGQEIFDFYWLVNRDPMKSETNLAGLLEPEYFRSGDYIECTVWSPANGEFGSVSFGSDTAYIF